MHNEPFSIEHKFTERILQLIEKLGESKQDEEVDKMTCEIIRTQLVITMTEFFGKSELEGTIIGRSAARKAQNYPTSLADDDLLWPLQKKRGNFSRAVSEEKENEIIEWYRSEKVSRPGMNKWRIDANGNRVPARILRKPIEHLLFECPYSNRVDKEKGLGATKIKSLRPIEILLLTKEDGLCVV